MTTPQGLDVLANEVNAKSSLLYTFIGEHLVEAEIKSVMLESFYKHQNFRLCQ